MRPHSDLRGPEALGSPARDAGKAIAYVKEATTKTWYFEGLSVRKRTERLERAQPEGAEPQEPRPGFSLKYFSNLPVSASYWARSAGGSPFSVMFGQTLA